MLLPDPSHITLEDLFLSLRIHLYPYSFKGPHFSGRTQRFLEFCSSVGIKSVSRLVALLAASPALLFTQKGFLFPIRSIGTLAAYVTLLYPECAESMARLFLPGPPSTALISTIAAASDAERLGYRAQGCALGTVQPWLPLTKELISLEVAQAMGVEAQFGSMVTCVASDVELENPYVFPLFKSAVIQQLTYLRQNLTSQAITQVPAPHISTLLLVPAQPHPSTGDSLLSAARSAIIAESLLLPYPPQHASIQLLQPTLPSAQHTTTPYDPVTIGATTVGSATLLHVPATSNPQPPTAAHSAVITESLSLQHPSQHAPMQVLQPPFPLPALPHLSQHAPIQVLQPPPPLPAPPPRPPLAPSVPLTLEAATFSHLGEPLSDAWYSREQRDTPQLGDPLFRAVLNVAPTAPQVVASDNEELTRILLDFRQVPSEFIVKFIASRARDDFLQQLYNTAGFRLAVCTEIVRAFRIIQQTEADWHPVLDRAMMLREPTTPPELIDEFRGSLQTWISTGAADFLPWSPQTDPVNPNRMRNQIVHEFRVMTAAQPIQRGEHLLILQRAYTHPLGAITSLNWDNLDTVAAPAVYEVYRVDGDWITLLFHHILIPPPANFDFAHFVFKSKLMISQRRPPAIRISEIPPLRAVPQLSSRSLASQFLTTSTQAHPATTLQPSATAIELAQNTVTAQLQQQQQQLHRRHPRHNQQQQAPEQSVQQVTQPPPRVAPTNPAFVTQHQQYLPHQLLQPLPRSVFDNSGATGPSLTTNTPGRSNDLGQAITAKASHYHSSHQRRRHHRTSQSDDDMSTGTDSHSSDDDDTMATHFKTHPVHTAADLYGKVQTWTSSTQQPLVNSTQVMRELLSEERCHQLMAHTGTRHITNYNVTTLTAGGEAVWRESRITDVALGTMFPVVPWCFLTWYVQKDKIPKVAMNILCMCWAELHAYGPDSPRLVHFLPCSQNKKELTCMADVLLALEGLATTYSILGGRHWGIPFTEFRDLLIDLQVTFLDFHYVEQYITSILRFLYVSVYNADTWFFLTANATAIHPREQNPQLWANCLSYELFARRDKLCITTNEAFSKSLIMMNLTIPPANTKLSAPTKTTTKPPAKKQERDVGKNKRGPPNNDGGQKGRNAGDNQPNKAKKKVLRIADAPRERLCLHALMRKYGTKFNGSTEPPSCREPCMYQHTKPAGFTGVEDFLQHTTKTRALMSEADNKVFEAKIRKDATLQ